jgi:hypothetical protein
MRVDGATTFSQIHQQLQPGGEFDGAPVGKHLRLSDKGGLHLKNADKGSGIHFMTRAEKHKEAVRAIKQSIDNDLGPGKGEAVFKNLKLSSSMVSVGDLHAIKQQVDIMTPLKPVLPAAVELGRVPGQPGLLQGRLDHAMGPGELTSFRRNFDHKLQASQQNGQFLKDYFRAEITLVDHTGSQMLPTKPGDDVAALMGLNRIAGKSLQTSSNLGAFLNQSAFNAMNEELGRAFANVNGDEPTLIIGRPRDENEKNQKITVTAQRDEFIIDFQLSSPLKGFDKNGTMLNLDNGQANTIEMGMQVRISRDDLENGRLDQYRITQPPTASMRMVFDPVNDRM